MFVRVAMLILSFSKPHELQRSVGDHLVRRHVGRSAGPALDYVHLKLFMKSAVDDLLACAFNSVKNLFSELLAVVIGTRGSQLHDG